MISRIGWDTNFFLLIYLLGGNFLSGVFIWKGEDCRVLNSGVSSFLKSLNPQAILFESGFDFQWLLAGIFRSTGFRLFGFIWELV